ncbi:MAG: hypothetical protein ACYDH6_17580 [Acidimicrobiales bacterium]
MEGSFDTSVRVLVCQNCGAALPPAPLGGGEMQCQYCRTVTMVAARDDRRLGQGAPVDEAARVASLWGQLGTGMMVHGEVTTIMERGTLPEKNVATAMKLWDDTRAKGSVDPASVGDDLLWLTSALVNFSAERGDRAKVRALWETALESSKQPRHLQYVRSALCRAAVNDGEDGAAQGWLAPCDPQPPDLMSDTSYRLSYACLVTAQGQFDAVIQALGDKPDSLPFFFSMRLLCGVMRANAIEKSGDVGTAVAQLKAFCAADPDVGFNLPSIATANPRLNLCPQSIPAAVR